MPAVRPDIRVWLHHGDAQPDKEHRPALKAHLGLTPNAGTPRVITPLGNGQERGPNTPEWTAEHTRTCRAAYADANVYDWVLRA